jgi:hypothetical protein
MNSLSVKLIVIGLLAILYPGISNDLSAAELENVDRAATDVIIQMNEMEITPQQQEALNSIQNAIQDSINNLPNPSLNDVQSDAQSELQNDPAAEEEPLTRTELKWKTLHTGFNILSDITSLAASTVFLATQVSTNPYLFNASSAVAVGSFIIEAFRGYTEKLKEFRRDSKSVPSVVAVASGVGQAASIVGLTFFATSLTSPESAAWLLVTGGFVKVTALVTEICVVGFNKAFANEHTVTNAIFRIGFLTVGGTVGGVILASGLSAESTDLVNAGIIILGGANFIGSLEILTRDIQDMQSYRKQLLENNVAPINP